MTAPRLVLVTRRFWPQVGGAGGSFALLAGGLKARGCQVTILTARWQPDWPEWLEHRGVPVMRLAHPPRSTWGALRHVQCLSAWLRKNRDRFDLVVASGLKHEAYAALSAARRGRFPVALRPEGAGLSGDCHWQLDARCGKRIKDRCMQAASLVATNPAGLRELIAAGYPRDRCHLVPCGVPVVPPRTAEARLAARKALARAHPALATMPDDPVALYAGRLHESKGLTRLVAAWEAVVARRPQARLWLAGEGPQYNALAAEVRRRGLAASVLLAGAFDQVDDLLAAADLFVAPALEEGTTLAVLEAMAAGLPVVATDIPGHKALIEQAIHGLLVPTDDAPSLADAVLRLLRQPDEARRLADAGRERVSRDYTLDRMVQGHLALFASLLGPASA